MLGSTEYEKNRSAVHRSVEFVDAVYWGFRVDVLIGTY